MKYTTTVIILLVVIQIITAAPKSEQISGEKSTKKTGKSDEKTALNQLALSARNDLDPNVITQRAAIGIANAAGIIAALFPNDGNTVNTHLNGNPPSKSKNK